MKNIVRQLNYYGFDDDNTMYEAHSSKKLDHMDVFAISKVKEQKNKKFMKKSEEEE
jgi:hypothetical protein